MRARLMNHAKKQREPFDLVLVRYGLERLLYRLSKSSHHDQFILKGAMLFQIWSDQPHRPTRDLDLLGSGTPSLDDFANIFRAMCDQPVEDDGIEFLPESVSASRMKEGEDYEGIRIKLEAKLAAARIPIQVDIGFGDVITPGPETITYPTTLDFPAPILKAYPRETVIAEKFQAMVMLGMANSRMKDFYDLFILCSQYEFAGLLVQAAIKATFDRRQTAIPQSTPLALTIEFTKDDRKQIQWQAFVRKSQLDTDEKTLSEIGSALTDFLMPPTQAILSDLLFEQKWTPATKWSLSSKR